MTQFTRNKVNMNISKSFFNQQSDKNKNYLNNKEKTQTKKQCKHALNVSYIKTENLRLIILF